jgi:3-oxoacyl-[acyl-carrier protein] reductase
LRASQLEVEFMDLSTLPKLPGIAGRVALVTGASRGIGRVIGEALAGQGARVVGTATTADGAAAISEWLGASGRGAVLDVGNDASVEALFATFGDNEGTPEILVNNAGITRDNLLMRMKAEEWNDVLSTNLTSIYRVCKASLRGMMKARFGRIVNVSSVVGLMGNAGQTNYAAAKAGMIGFSKSLAREIASRNVTVNVVAPGFIDTDMTRALDEKQVQTLRAQIPLARLGTSADVAAAVLFLASDLGAYVTGETLNVNGGLLMQ